jgi:hypothetical protein
LFAPDVLIQVIACLKTDYTKRFSAKLADIKLRSFARTIFQSTDLPLTVWFLVIYLISQAGPAYPHWH